MFISFIHGQYHFNKKIIGYGRCTCFKCNNSDIALVSRSFQVIHLFWVPIIPVGIVKHNICSNCKNKNELSIFRSDTLKFLVTTQAIGLTALLLGAALMLPDFVKITDNYSYYFAYFFLAAGTIICAYGWYDLHKAKKHNAITSKDIVTCPFCSTPHPHSASKCPNCCKLYFNDLMR
jgi:hypothetical protein